MTNKKKYEIKDLVLPKRARYKDHAIGTIDTYNELIVGLSPAYNPKNEGYIIGKARGLLLALWFFNEITDDQFTKRANILSELYIYGVKEVLK